MKTRHWFLALVLALVVALPSFAANAARREREARGLESAGNYVAALTAYCEAQEAYKAAGDAEQARACRDAGSRCLKMVVTYPFTADVMRELAKASLEGVTDAVVDQWIADGRIDHVKMGETTYYFMQYDNTVQHIYYPRFQNKDHSHDAQVVKAKKALFDYILKPQTDPDWKTMRRPLVIDAAMSVNIPRDSMPHEGTVRFWFPLPILSDAQRDVEIVSVKPARYVKGPARIDAEIGQLYMEVPLAELKTDLKIDVKVRWKRYEERFAIDPDRIGAYDRASALYKEYTASRGHTVVSPEIARAARQLAGKETNPWKIVRIFYDYVVDEIDYSYTPHMALDVTGDPHSIYVFKHRFGDCGAQSSLFAALCRAVGIPARVTGGLQAVPGIEGGHFWAEVYLPNYGWVPVDTSVGQLVRYDDKMTAAEKKAFREYYCGNLDPFRWIIQTDLDRALEPAPTEPVFMLAAVQQPVVTCAEMDDFPAFLFGDFIKITAKARRAKN